MTDKTPALGEFTVHREEWAWDKLNKYKCREVTRAKEMDPSGEKTEGRQGRGGVGGAVSSTAQESPGKPKPEQKPHR